MIYGWRQRTKMTKQSLLYAIQRLIVKRAEAHDDPKEQERINARLTQLYDFKFLMDQQEASANSD